MKIAIYKDMSINYERVAEVTDYLENGKDVDIRLSEIMEVEFIMLPYGDAEKKQIEVIETQIKAVQAAAHMKVTELEEKKAELLAIGDSNET